MLRFPLLFITLALALPAAAGPFVFRGQLDDGIEPAEGAYALRLTLYPSERAKHPLAGPLELPAVPVSDGRFATEVDFGELAPSLTHGFLEVSVKAADEAGDYVAVGERSRVELKAINACAASWNLAGNALTDPATDFLGTTDASALEIRTRNARSLRIEPSAELSGGAPITANLIGGSHANDMNPGLRGVTIAGGGLPEGDSDPFFADEGPNLVSGHFGAVGGGFDNHAGAYSVTAGGINNRAVFDGSSIGGGVRNLAGAPYASIGGGTENIVNGSYATIGGGNNNLVDGDRGFVGAGAFNTAVEEAVASGGRDNRAAALGTAIGGGEDNLAAASYATIPGGLNNWALGAYAIAAGGTNNCAGADFSFAAGFGAKVRPGTSAGVGPCGGLTYPGGDGDIGSFVWADSSGGAFASTGPDQFAIRARGGVHLASSTSLFFGADARQAINLFNASYGVGVQSGTTYFRSGSRFAFFEDGVHSDTALDPGAGGKLLMTLNASDPQTPQGVVRAQMFVPVSDREAKTGFAPVDPLDVLARVLELPLSEWRYKSAPDARHIGPTAQDFHAAFGLNGADDKAIATVDADGVMLAALQGLNVRLEAENAQLRAALGALDARIQSLEESLGCPRR